MVTNCVQLLERNIYLRKISKLKVVRKKTPVADESGCHCLPRHQTWAGYTTRTDVHNIHTHHYNIIITLQRQI